MFGFSLTVALMLTQPAPSAAGDWKLNGTIGEFPVDLVCTLKPAEQKVTGSCKGDPIGELPITGEVNGATIKWSYEVNFQGQALTIVYTATLESASAMKGAISVMGTDSGTFTGKKQ